MVPSVFSESSVFLLMHPLIYSCMQPFLDLIKRFSKYYKLFYSSFSEKLEFLCRKFCLCLPEFAKNSKGRICGKCSEKLFLITPFPVQKGLPIPIYRSMFLLHISLFFIFLFYNFVSSLVYKSLLPDIFSFTDISAPQI